jgi:hypothetical protein
VFKHWVDAGRDGCNTRSICMLPSGWAASPRGHKDLAYGDLDGTDLKRMGPTRPVEAVEIGVLVDRDHNAPGPGRPLPRL